MVRHKIPTARFQIADSPEMAMKIIRSGEFLFPMVLKADGLAGGKGAIICNNLKKAEETVHNLMIKKNLARPGKESLLKSIYEAMKLPLSLSAMGKMPYR